MHPVQHFKANFSQEGMTDATSENQTGYTAGSTELHDIDSNVRNLCFVREGGRRVFFNYAYLVSVDLVVTDTLNEMILYFSEQVVIVKGYELGILFDLLLNHTPKTITAINLRYHQIEQIHAPLVIDIQIVAN